MAFSLMQDLGQLVPACYCEPQTSSFFQVYVIFFQKEKKNKILLEITGPIIYQIYKQNT